MKGRSKHDQIFGLSIHEKQMEVRAMMTIKQMAAEAAKRDENAEANAKAVNQPYNRGFYEGQAVGYSQMARLLRANDPESMS